MQRFLLQTDRKIFAFLIIATIFLGLVPVSANAQASGTLIGQVFDQSRNQMPNVKVEIINENNGTARATLTDETGTYRVPFLPPGLYRITAILSGFTSDSVRAFRIPLNQTTPLRPPDITLRPDTTATTTPTTPTPTGQVTERTEPWR
jgi:hypothetical protein